MAQPACAFCCARVRVMTSPACSRTIALADPILTGLGYGAGRVATIETDDPDALGEALRAIAPGQPRAAHASFRPAGGKRDVQRLALRELHRVAPQPVDVIALPQGAPFGAIEVNAEGCTLCLACVSACPTGAMSADPDRPMLKFTEDACVQCGLCAATCPEKVITLTPQLDFRAATAAPRIMKQEDPFECIRCSKPFGVKSTIERVTAKLEGKHWMFKGHAERLNVLKMCEDCRVFAVTEQALRSLWRRHSRAAQAAHRRRLSARGAGEGAELISLVSRTRCSE